MNKEVEKIEKIIEKLQGESSGMSPYIDESDITILAQVIWDSLDIDVEKLIPILVETWGYGDRVKANEIKNSKPITVRGKYED